MWISKQLVEARKKQPAAEVSHISSYEEARPKSMSADLAYCGPWGIAYSPPSYTQGVVIETSLGAACVGTLTDTAADGLEPGELYLFSKGGASIRLKNNGEVEINGQVFAPASKTKTEGE